VTALVHQARKPASAGPVAMTSPVAYSCWLARAAARLGSPRLRPLPLDRVDFAARAISEIDAPSSPPGTSLARERPPQRRCFTPSRNHAKVAKWRGFVGRQLVSG
jgi:hypothetical protein